MGSSTRRRFTLGSQYWLVGGLALLTAILLSLLVVRTIDAPSATEASLSGARKVLRGPATISVIGDSTGNDDNEWVALWAADLGRDRQVTLHMWRTGRYRSEPLMFGQRGDQITIWNGSHGGGAANWAIDQLDIVQPEQPDLIILSLGHNNTEGDIISQLEQLRGRLSEGVPVVLILQNPGRGDRKERQAATLRAAQGWARTRSVPIIDVNAVFTDPDRQMFDTAHPNELGSRVWAETVAEALSA